MLGADGADGRGSPQGRPRALGATWVVRLARSGTVRLVVTVSLLALVLRVVTAVGDFRTTDERDWMFLSSSFHDAVGSGDFESASAGIRGDNYTSPGVTTMWIGAAACVVWSLGNDSTFHTSPSGLDIAQLMMAVLTAALLGLLVFLLIRWVGLGAAGVAGVVLATEPFFVAHGAVLHTDELLAFFGVASLVATALALGIPARTPWTGRWWAGAVAGALFGGAWLTKVSAFMFLPTVALLGAWALVRAVRDRGDDQAPTADRASLLRVGCWWVVTAGVVIVALYPALWVSPIGELKYVYRSARIAGIGHRQFFLGEITSTPGPLYYLVALPLRTTPWFLVGGLVAMPLLWVRRATTPGFGLALLSMAAPTLLIVSVAAKQFDRYGLAVLVILAIGGGIVVASSVARLGPESLLRRRAGATGILAALVVGVHSFVVAPWGLAYFNPALGGAEVAEGTLLVGWGEGVEQAERFIARREAGRCASVTVSGLAALDQLSCGKQVNAWEGSTYFVVYINQRQRMTREQIADLVAHRELVGTVEELGVTYAEIYGPRAPDT